MFCFLRHRHLPSNARRWANFRGGGLVNDVAGSPHEMKLNEREKWVWPRFNLKRLNNSCYWLPITIKRVNIIAFNSQLLSVMRMSRSRILGESFRILVFVSIAESGRIWNDQNKTRMNEFPTLLHDTGRELSISRKNRLTIFNRCRTNTKKHVSIWILSRSNLGNAPEL